MMELLLTSVVTYVEILLACGRMAMPMAVYSLVACWLNLTRSMVCVHFTLDYSELIYWDK